MSLPHGGHRTDIIRKKAFEDYLRDHVVSWFTWTQDNKLGVERMEELILVSGCTLATSWAVAAFVDNTMEAEISLASRTLGDNGGASFIWSNKRGSVPHNNSRFDPVSLTPPRFSFPWHALTPFVWKAKSTNDSGSVRLHQGFQSKARPLLDQANRSCRRTSSGRP